MGRSGDQNVGPLVGMRTWGGLAAPRRAPARQWRGTITAPCIAVFGPGDGWIAEKQGVASGQRRCASEAKSVAQGRDPQLERGVQEAIKLLEGKAAPRVAVPPFPKPAAWPRIVGN